MEYMIKRLDAVIALIGATLLAVSIAAAVLSAERQTERDLYCFIESCH